MAEFELRQIRQINRDLDRFTSKVITSLAADVSNNLFDDTPKDTGWARSNWLASAGESIDKPFGVRSVRSAGQANAQRKALLSGLRSSYRLEQGNVFISNNVPYIVFLNEGTSRQAPRGYVQQAIGRTVTSSLGRLES